MSSDLCDLFCHGGSTHWQRQESAEARSAHLASELAPGRLLKAWLQMIQSWMTMTWCIESYGDLGSPWILGKYMCFWGKLWKIPGIVGIVNIFCDELLTGAFYVGNGWDAEGCWDDY